MVKVRGKIDLSKVKAPYIPLRFVIKSKNRRKSSDVVIHLEFGKYTEQEAKDICAEANSRFDGRYYWPIKEDTREVQAIAFKNHLEGK